MLTLGGIAVVSKIAISALQAFCTQGLIHRYFGETASDLNGQTVRFPDWMNDDFMADNKCNQVKHSALPVVAAGGSNEPDLRTRNATVAEKANQSNGSMDQTDPLPHYTVQEMDGPAPAEDKLKILNWVSAAAPDSYPEAIILVPRKEYDKLRTSIRHQMLGGQVISASSGKNGQEHFGGLHPTQVGDGFSIRSIGRIYLNADILKKSNYAKEILFHELGHLAADDASEDKANKFRNLYIKRSKDTEALWNGIKSLPVGRCGLRAMAAGCD